MTFFHLGAAIAIGSTLIAWSAFRRPGVSFWSVTPIWQADRALVPLGARIWITGFGIGATLMVAHLLGRLF